MTEIMPTYEELTENGKWHFLQTIEKEITNESINYIENPNTGGCFWIYENGNNNSLLGLLCLYQGKLYIINDDTQSITPLSTNTLEDLNELKSEYNIGYQDKEKPNELQLVYIEDENNIQTDKGVVLSFDKIDSNNPNSNLYLYGIYNGEFKEIIDEKINQETKEKTTQTKKVLTGNANMFYANGDIYIQGSLEGSDLKPGKWYRENGILWKEGTFIENEHGYTVLNGENCTEYYEDGKTVKYNGLFQNGYYIIDNDKRVLINNTFPDIAIKAINILLYNTNVEFKDFKGPLKSEHLNDLNKQPTVIMIYDDYGFQHTVFYDGNKIYDSWYNCFFDDKPSRDYRQYYADDIINNKDTIFSKEALQQNSTEGHCVLFSIVHVNLYKDGRLDKCDKLIKSIRTRQLFENIANINDNIDFHINKYWNRKDYKNNISLQ